MRGSEPPEVVSLSRASGGPCTRTVRDFVQTNSYWRVIHSCVVADLAETNGGGGSEAPLLRIVGHKTDLTNDTFVQESLGFVPVFCPKLYLGLALALDLCLT